MEAGADILVENGTTRKYVKLESVTRGRVTVYWPLAGQYEVDLQTGDLLSQVLPVNGLFRVDCVTGRVEGTRCCVAPEDLVRLEELRPGDTLRLTHDAQAFVQADVVDALPSEATLRIYVRTRSDAWHVGKPIKTGWRVEASALRALCELAGVEPRAAAAGVDPLA